MQSLKGLRQKSRLDVTTTGVVTPDTITVPTSARPSSSAPPTSSYSDSTDGTAGGAAALAADRGCSLARVAANAVVSVPPRSTPLRIAIV